MAIAIPVFTFFMVLSKVTPVGVRLGNAVTALLLLRMLDTDFVGYSSQLRDAILSLLVGSIVALIACVVPWTERATRILSTRLNHFGGSSCLSFFVDGSVSVLNGPNCHVGIILALEKLILASAPPPPRPLTVLNQTSCSAGIITCLANIGRPLGTGGPGLGGPQSGEVNGEQSPSVGEPSPRGTCDTQAMPSATCVQVMAKSCACMPSPCMVVACSARKLSQFLHDAYLLTDIGRQQSTESRWSGGDDDDGRSVLTDNSVDGAHEEAVIRLLRGETMPVYCACLRARRSGSACFSGLQCITRWCACFGRTCRAVNMSRRPLRTEPRSMACRLL